MKEDKIKLAVKEKLWIQNDGSFIPIADMSTNHIANALACYHNGRITEKAYNKLLPFLIKEYEKRCKIV